MKAIHKGLLAAALACTLILGLAAAPLAAQTQGETETTWPPETESSSSTPVEVPGEPEEPSQPEGEGEPEEPLITPFDITEGFDPDRNIATILENMGAGSTSILDSFQLLGPDGLPLEEVTVGDNFTVNVDFILPDELVAYMAEEGGDFYYSFKLPAELKVDSTQTFPLEGGGYFTVETDGTVTIVFQDIDYLYDVNGNINFTGQLNEEEIDGNGTTVITVPDEEELPPVTIVVKPDVESTIDKNGYSAPSVNPTQVMWNVDINKALDTLDGATVSEYFPAGTSYDSLVIYELELDIYGEVVSVGAPLTPGLDYTVDTEGNVVFLRPISEAYRLSYVTNIDDASKPAAGGTVTFVNEAVLGADNLDEDASASASTTGNYGKKLSKIADGYDPETQTFYWTIHYNHNETSLPAGSAVVNDTFEGGGILLENGTLQVIPMEIAGDGTETPSGPPLELGQDYDLVDTGSGFRVVFLVPIDYAVDIVYSTQVEGILDNSQAFYNSVEDGEGNTSGQGVTADQQGIVKTIPSYNRDDETIDWRVTVNGNHYEMHNWWMEDHNTNGLTMVPGSFTVRNADTGVPLVLNTDYTFTPLGDGFRIDLINTYNPTTAALEITYTTDYDPLEAENNRYVNTATSHWDDGENEHSSSDDATYTLNDQEQHNGSKSGSYNAVTKEITWTVIIDYTNSGLESAYLKDEIIGNQNFVPGSGRVYHYNVQPGGNTVRGDELTSEEYAQLQLVEPTEDDPHYYVYLPDVPPGDEGGQLWFEYKTSLEGEFIDSPYLNEAVFRNALTPEYTLNASVSIPNGGDLVGKGGERGQDGYVWWNITVNPSQSTLDDVLVTDVPSSNQLVDLSSLVVYGTNVTTGGGISIDTGTVLEQGVDYEASYTQDADGVWRLRVQFLHQIDRPYIIRYRVYVLSESGTGSETLTNNVTVSGTHEETEVDEGGSTIVVDVGTGGGIIVGERGAIIVQKTGAGGAVLPGAVFQLYIGDPQAGGTPLGDPITTDATGRLEFTGIPSSSTQQIYIREISAPPGYTISTALWQGVPIEVFIDPDASDFTPLANELGEVQLHKSDADTGDDLDGVVFELYAQDESGAYVRIRTDETFVTDTDGLLSVRGLPVGNYYFLEVVQHPGYQPNPDPVYFTVDVEEGALVSNPGSPIEVTNVPTRVVLTKVDAQDNSITLAGAEFELEQLVGGQWVRIRESELFITGPDGTLLVEHLAEGTYRFVEIAPPNGQYTLGTEPVEFTLAPDEDGYILEYELEFPNEPTRVTLIKTGVNGARLADAEFMLEIFDETLSDWVRVPDVNTTYTTGTDGTLSVLRLLPGTYRFTEVRAPAGYSLDPTPIEFALVAGADGVVVPVTRSVANAPSLASLYKVSPDGTGLQGAEFRVEQYVNGAWVSVREGLVSDTRGLVTVSALGPGRYRFVETRAPAGYQLAQQSVEFTLEAGADGVILPVDAGSLVNRPSPSVSRAQTGDSTDLTLYAALAGGAVLGAGGALYLRRRKRKD